MKLNILNIQDFLDTINACRDEVYMICSNGQKVNIRGQYPIQDELHRQYYDHKNQLQIILEAQNPKAVSYTHLRAHETGRNLVCRLLLEKKKKKRRRKRKKKTTKRVQ